MKKFIQICSILTLLVVFTVVSVSANTNNGFGTEVEIPFAFNVGDRSYDAGDYIVRIQRLSDSTTAFSIQDTKTDEIQTVLLNNFNSDGSGGNINLVFDNVGGQKYLRKVQTADRTFALIKGKSEKNAAAVAKGF